jgi:hypothetical protein
MRRFSCQLLTFDLSPASDINVVLFSALGYGKSSIINLLAGKPIAKVSTNMEPCTKQPRCYQISIGGDICPLLPYEQAHTVLRVHLLLLCARKDEITSLGSLYRLINDFFFGGQAPIAIVGTHCYRPTLIFPDLSLFVLIF